MSQIILTLCNDGFLTINSQELASCSGHEQERKKNKPSPEVHLSLVRQTDPKMEASLFFLVICNIIIIIYDQFDALENKIIHLCPIQTNV